MAIAFRSESHIAPASGTSATGTEPTGTTAGDVVFGLYIVDNPGGAIGMPTGWTTVASITSTSTHFRAVFGWVARGGSAPSYLFSQANSAYRELFLVTFSGVDTTTPIEVSGTAVTTTATTVKPDPPQITGMTAGAEALVVYAMWGGGPASGGWTASTNYTMRSVNAGSAGCIESRNIAAGGTENPGQPGGTPQAGDDGWTNTYSLKPSSGSPAVTVKTLATLGVG